MARTDTLPHFLTDVADAIRTKTGSSDPIQASAFDTAIENIPSGGLDWSLIGYSETPKTVKDGYDYAKQIYDNWVQEKDLGAKFYGDTNLVFMPLVDTSIVTNLRTTFSGCKNLVNIPLIDTSSCTNFNQTFFNCTSIKEIQNIDISNATDLGTMFYGCSQLTTIPQLSFCTKKGANASGMFQVCPSLSNNSIDNILKMCINATNYTRTKTLYELGFRSTVHSAEKIQALPSYQDFIDAGWTIGY